MGMKTYLTVTFNSEGAKPSEIVDRLCMIGFRPTQGTYDFIYEWDKKATVKDAIWFGDKEKTEAAFAKAVSFRHIF